MIWNVLFSAKTLTVLENVLRILKIPQNFFDCQYLYLIGLIEKLYSFIKICSSVVHDSACSDWFSEEQEVLEWPHQISRGSSRRCDAAAPRRRGDLWVQRRPSKDGSDPRLVQGPLRLALRALPLPASPWLLSCCITLLLLWSEVLCSRLHGNPPPQHPHPERRFLSRHWACPDVTKKWKKTRFF